MTRPIAWDNAPPAEQARTTYEMIRCPATSTGPWLITSPKVIGVQIYWMNGRSNPHLAADCPGCAENKPHRWNGWLAVYDERRMRHCILEITPLCLGTIADYELAQGTLRGARIVLRRPNGKANGRIVAELTKSELSLPQIPETFDLQAELTRLWDAPNRSNRPRLETPRPIPSEEDEPEPTQTRRRKHPAESVQTITHEESLAIQREREALKKARDERKRRADEKLKKGQDIIPGFNQAAQKATHNGT